jgi:hypothetical protein
MFCDASPIWRFLKELGAEENPERAQEREGRDAREMSSAVYEARRWRTQCVHMLQCTREEGAREREPTRFDQEADETRAWARREAGARRPPELTNQSDDVEHH